MRRQGPPRRTRRRFGSPLEAAGHSGLRPPISNIQSAVAASLCQRTSTRGSRFGVLLSQACRRERREPRRPPAKARQTFLEMIRREDRPRSPRPRCFERTPDSVAHEKQGLDNGRFRLSVFRSWLRREALRVDGCGATGTPRAGRPPWLDRSRGEGETGRTCSPDWRAAVRSRERSFPLLWAENVNG